MAVQARHLSHAFRVTDDATVGGSTLLDEFSRCAPAAAGVGDTTRLRDLPRSDGLTMCDYGGFEPRKRPRVAADGFAADQRVALPAAASTVEAPPRWDDDVASTSGRAACVSGGGLLQSRLYNQQGAEIDAVVRLESERMRAGLREARRRHARALLAAAERAASRRLRAAEAELERALRRNAELEDRARQAAAECQAWMGVAGSHEAVAAGLRAALDQLLRSPPCAAADAEDARSCCFELEAPPAAGDGDDDDVVALGPSAVVVSACKACGAGGACVLLLPCRHLCLCRACDAAVDACPVCAAAKNASLHVLLP